MSDFVSFEIAKKLKEKGFCEQCLGYYTKDSNFYYNVSYGSDVENAFKSFNSRPNHICGKRIDAPTISQVLKWLKDKFSLHISKKPYACKDGLMWMYEIRKFNKRIVFVIVNKTGFVKEEEASLAGIEYSLDNLI